MVFFILPLDFWTFLHIVTYMLANAIYSILKILPILSSSIVSSSLAFSLWTTALSHGNLGNWDLGKTDKNKQQSRNLRLTGLSPDPTISATNYILPPQRARQKKVNMISYIYEILENIH